MAKYEKISVDWEKKFKNLYLDTSSKAKNFFRLDWTKKSINRKNEYNKKVDYAVGYVKLASNDYNNMVSLLSKVNSDYEKSYSELSKRIKALESDCNSAQSKLNDFHRNYTSMAERIDIAKKVFGRVSKNVNFKTKPPSNPGTLKNKTNKYKKSIEEVRNEISKIDTRIKKLDARINDVSGNILAVIAELSDPENDEGTKEGLESRLSDLNKNMKHLRNDKAEFESDRRELINKLSKMKDDINKKMDKTVSDKLSEVRKNVAVFLGDINILRGVIDSNRSKLESFSKSSNVFTTSYLDSFNNEVNKCHSEIMKTFNGLIKFNDDDDYKGEWYRLISTKEKRIDEFIKAVQNIHGSIELNYKTMSNFKKDMEAKAKSKETDGAGDIIKKQISVIEGSIGALLSKLDESTISFNNELKKIGEIIVIVPKCDTNNLLKSVEEQAIVI